MIFECVINVSEGRDVSALNSIALFGESCLLDLHVDPDHNRSVITLGSHSLDELSKCTRAVSKAAFKAIDFINHSGVHPRLGSIDVVPFISYDNLSVIPSEETIIASKDFGSWINNEFDVGVYFYDYASENKTSLPEIRKNAGTTLQPNIGSQKESIKHGSVCVGAREPLVAVNVNLQSQDLSFAKSIAKEIRMSSGGIPGVRAIGLDLTSKKSVQVSMNIVDSLNVNVGEICETIRDKASARNIDSEVELVGLVPDFQYSKWTPAFLEWSQLDQNVTVEFNL